jgi:transcriptional regulator with XRE-family HTH domain
MAAAIGVSRNHMSRILNSRIHINVDQLAAMAEFVGMRAVELVAQAEDAAESARDALINQLDDQLPPIQPPPRVVRTAEDEPNAG